MNTQEQDKIKVEFVRWYHQQHNEKGLAIQIPSKDINEWWIARLSQAIQTERETWMRNLERMLNFYSVNAPKSSRAATFTPEQFMSVLLSSKEESHEV